MTRRLLMTTGILLISATTFAQIKYTAPFYMPEFSGCINTGVTHQRHDVNRHNTSPPHDGAALTSLQRVTR